MAKFNYDKALEELQQIVTELQSEDTGLEDLSKKIAKAKTLIEQCKTKLRSVEDDINKIIEPSDS